MRGDKFLRIGFLIFFLSSLWQFIQPITQQAECGSFLSTYKGVDALSNGTKQHSPESCVEVKGTYGWQYQCVEYVKRFYSLALGIDTRYWSVNAVDFFSNAKKLGLNVYKNGESIIPPAPDDILVFEDITHKSQFGHVAIITGVNSNVVSVIEQNWSNKGTDNLTLTTNNGIFRINRRGNYEILGWLRTPQPKVTISPNTGPIGTQFSINWSDFTQNSTLISHLKKPDGTEFETLSFTTDKYGNASYAVDSTGFTAGTYEHWAIDDATGKSSNIVTFIVTATCTPPGTPSNPSPSNGATNISIKADLDWSDCARAISYDIYFGTTSPLPLVANVTNSSYDLVSLSYNTTYYWKVVAKNSCGESSSPIWNFMTQPPPSQNLWAKAYRGGGYNGAYSIKQTSDGGYIVVGFTNSDQTRKGSIWILKLNTLGDIEWQKTYPESKGAYSVQQTNEGGYIVVGRISNGILVLKLDIFGNIEWQKSYPADSWTDKPYSIHQTFEGGYIVTGWDDSTGILVLKLNTSGNIEWQKTYAGIVPTFDNEDSIQQTFEGGYILASSEASILKLNSFGDIEWQKKYGGPDWEYFSSIQQTHDGGYIIAGFVIILTPMGGWSDSLVIKLNSLGDIEWQKTYGGSSHDEAYSIDQTSDGGYIVAGWSQSFGTVDSWIIKLNSEGQIEWQKTYGGLNHEYAYSIQEIFNGGFIVAGSTSSIFNPETNRFEQGILVLKIASNGEIDPSCGFEGISNATVSDSNIIPQYTNIVPQNTNVTPQNTNIALQDTNAVVYLICSGLRLILF